ncbi:MAG TPA: glycosyltransferase family 4 protein [Candidatus Eisenbacteria bacterium]|jgi:glycosyltransferase involved in cell wall biosynthesis
MRVVHVIGSTEVGGGPEHLVHLTRGLRAHGVDGCVITGIEGGARARLEAAGTPVRVLGPMGAGAIWTLARAIRGAEPDLLHLHGGRAGFLGTLAARAVSMRPVVYTAHMFSFMGPKQALRRWAALRAESLTCAQADRVICVSRSDRDAAAARGIDAARFAVVPSGIDLTRFPAATDRRSEFGLAHDVPVVGAITRLVDEKDPATFVRMAAHVAERVPEARFLLVGDGPLRPTLERIGRELVRSGRLFLTGFRSDVPELLATLDVVAFPSLSEAQGIALIEAMAAARPVVASDLASHAEAIVPGTGVLTPPGDPEGLAAEIVALLRDRPRREALGRRARQQVEGRYSADRMVESTLAIYREVLECSGAGRPDRRSPAATAHSR